MAADDDVEVPEDVLARIRSVCLALPEVDEEQAWVGTRWRIRGRTFAHVLVVDSGWPPAYARAAGLDGPARIVTFRSSGEELDVLRHAGHPFFAPPWRADEVGLVLEPDVDWIEVAELLTESYCVLAPRRLAQTVRASNRLTARGLGRRAAMAAAVRADGGRQSCSMSQDNVSSS